MDPSYIEDGYVEAAYFERIIVSDAIGLTPYFAEDYAETGYAEQRGSVFTLYANTDTVIVTGTATLSMSASISTTIGKLENVSVDINSESTVVATPYRILELSANIDSAMSASMTAIAFKNHDAHLDSAFTMVTDVNVQTDTDGLLEYFADLNAQAARFRDADAAMSAQFYTSDNSFDIGANIDVNATLDAASILTSTASLTVDALILKYGDANLSSEFTQTADAIEYIKKSDQESSTVGRPWATKYISQDIDGEDVPVFDSNTKAFGSHSLRIYNSTTQNSYVTYYSDNTVGRLPRTGDSFHLETWIRGYDAPLITIRDNSNIVQMLIYVNNGTQLIVRYRTGSGSFSSISGSIVDSAYVVVKAEAGVVKLYLNGSLAATSTVNYDGMDINEIVFGDDDTWGGSTTQGYAYIDEFRILKGSIADIANEVGYAFSATSVPVPTEQFTNTANTQLLLHFNNSYFDDIYGLQESSANLSGAFNATATITGSVFAGVDLSSAFTMDVDATNIKEASAEFDAVASQLSAVGKIGQLFVNADVVASLDIAEDLFKSFDSDLTSQFTTDIEIVKTTDAQADFVGVFTPTLTVEVNRRAEIELSSETQLTADAVRIRAADAVIDAQATMQISGYVVTDININIDANVTMVVSGFVKVFNLDQYVYTIPKETRSYTIQNENRLQTITNENRTYTIEGT